jgi:hypothetical protein
VPRVPPELIAALGTAPDAEIAARFGRNESSVRSLRLDRGIPPSIAGRERLILDTLAAHLEPDNLADGGSNRDPGGGIDIDRLVGDEKQDYREEIKKQFHGFRISG